MGKAIVYCGDCGKSLHEEDFAKGKAFTDESGPYCVGCRPLPQGHAPSPLQQGSSSRLKAVAPSVQSPGAPPAIPRPPSTTRRAAAPSSGGKSAGLFIGGGVAAAALVGILFLAMSGSDRKPPPPRSIVNPPPPPPSVPADPDKAKVEREMRAQRERDEAARLDPFLDQIRGLLRDVPNLPRRREEVEGMLAAAGKIAGARQVEVEALRAEWGRKLREAEFEALLPPIREMAGNAAALLDNRAEVERMLAEAEKAAGPRRSEVDALRAEIARKIEEASKPWSVSLGFEAGFEKGLEKVDDWKGLKYTEEPRNVHGGRRAVHIGIGGVGAAFVMKGVREGPTYVMSCWARKGEGGDEGYVGFEFWGARGRLTKHGFKIESREYGKITHELQAPRGTKTLMFWVWSDGKGEFFVDDVEVALKEP